jgi:hypothetical protein
MADGSIGSSENLGHSNLFEAATLLIEAAIWMEAQRPPRVRTGNGYSHEGTESEVDSNADAAEFEQS